MLERTRTRENRKKDGGNKKLDEHEELLKESRPKGRGLFELVDTSES